MSEYGKQVKSEMNAYMNDLDSITKEINDIQNAIHGVEVRGALAASVKKAFDKSVTSLSKSIEAIDITQNLLDESFDASVIEKNFEERLDAEIKNLQPEWTSFKEETTQQLAEKAQQEDLEKTNNNVDEKADKIYVDKKINNKANKDEVRRNDVPIGLNDVGNDLLGAIQGSSTVNVLSRPKLKSVTPATTDFIKRGKNLFNKNQLEMNKRVDSNGNVEANNDYATTLYIAVEPNTDYIMSGTSSTPVSYYDGSFDFIDGDISTKHFKTPNNCYYIRKSVEKTDVERVQLEKGTEETDYESYHIKMKDNIFEKENRHKINMIYKNNGNIVISTHPSEWEFGNITSSGTEAPVPSLNRIRSNDFIEIKNSKMKMSLSRDYSIRFRIYNDKKDLIGQAYNADHTGDKVIDFSIDYPRAYYIKIVFLRRDDGVMTLEDINKSEFLLTYETTVINELNLVTHNVGNWNYGDRGGYEGDLSEEEFEFKWKALFNEYSYDLIALQDYSEFVDTEEKKDAYDLFFKDNTLMNRLYLDGRELGVVSRIPFFAHHLVQIGEVEHYEDIQKLKINVNNKVITIYNMHLPPSSLYDEERADIFRDLIKDAQNNDYTIFMGDFNARNIEEYNVFKNSGFNLANGGYLGARKTIKDENFADNIITSDNIIISKIKFFEDEDSTSDHQPIQVKLKIL